MCLLKQYLFIKLNVTEEQRNFFSCSKMMLFMIAETEIGDVAFPDFLINKFYYTNFHTLLICHDNINVIPIDTHCE